MPLPLVSSVRRHIVMVLSICGLSLCLPRSCVVQTKPLSNSYHSALLIGMPASYACVIDVDGYPSAGKYIWSHCDLDLGPLTLNIFSAVVTRMMVTCAKFHQNPFHEVQWYCINWHRCRDCRPIDNTRMAGRTTRKHKPLDIYCWQRRLKSSDLKRRLKRECANPIADRELINSHYRIGKFLWQFIFGGTSSLQWR